MSRARRMPDKDTLLRLRGEGLTLKQIGEAYGVTQQAVSWALKHEPKLSELGVCHIPQHVLDYWRSEWGWSEDKIYQTCQLYAQSLMKR